MTDTIYVKTTQAGKDTYIKLERDLFLKDHPEYQHELGGRRKADFWYKPSWLSSNSYPCYNLESFYTTDKNAYIYDEAHSRYYLTCRSLVPDSCIRKVTTHYLLPCFHVNIMKDAHKIPIDTDFHRLVFVKYNSGYMYDYRWLFYPDWQGKDFKKLKCIN